MLARLREMVLVGTKAEVIERVTMSGEVRAMLLDIRLVKMTWTVMYSAPVRLRVPPSWSVERGNSTFFFFLQKDKVISH